MALAEPLASDRAAVGDEFSAVLVGNLMGEGRILARAQNRVRGRIIDVRQGADSVDPMLALSLVSVEADAGWIPLSTDPLVITGRRQSKTKRFLRGVSGAVRGAMRDAQEEGPPRGTLIGTTVETIVNVRGTTLEIPAEGLARFQLAQEVRVSVRR